MYKNGILNVIDFGISADVMKAVPEGGKANRSKVLSNNCGDSFSWKFVKRK